MAKKPGAGGIILLAVILGLVTAYFVWNYLRDVAKGTEKGWQQVIVATQDIPARKKITREMIQPVQMSPKHIAPDAVRELKQVEGKITKSRVKLKDQLRQSDVVQEGEIPSLAIEVPAGKRAITIPAGEVMAVGTAIRPGDRVDILATYHDPVNKQETTRIILQDVPVLAVNKGDTEGKGEGASSSMTLVISPEEVEVVTAADRAGALRIALRGVEDKRIVETSGVTTREFTVGGRSGRLVMETRTESTETRATPVIISPPPSRPPRDITVYKGGQKETVPVE